MTNECDENPIEKILECEIISNCERGRKMGNSKRYDGIINSYLESRTGLELHQFISMVQLSNDESRMIELVKDFCQQSHSNLDNRLALEFFYLHGCHEELTYFIHINKESDNPLNRLYANYYQHMSHASLNRKIDEIIEMTPSILTSDLALQCLHYFLYAEIDITRKQYDRLGYYLNKIQTLLQKIDNPLLATSFNIRTHILLFMYYWKRNELILARKHAYRVLQHPDYSLQKAKLHIYLGLSYIYEDFEAAIYHIDEATLLAKRLENKEIVNYIADFAKPFICAHFGQIEGVMTTNPIEQAHIEIAKGNQMKAKNILEQLSVETPFTQYYLGLATNEQKYFIHSFEGFMEQRGDHFFAKLPLHATEMVGL